MYRVDNWEISVPAEELLRTLKSNRETHITDFNEAVAAYREQVKGALRARLAELDSLTEPRQFLSNKLKCPESYGHVYDRVIKMLEMTDTRSVNINGKQFAEWVEDKWDWSESFAANTLSYK
jgi:hypothetical protein